MQEVHTIADVLRELLSAYDSRGLLSPDPKEKRLNDERARRASARMPIAPSLGRPESTNESAVSGAW
jgi:hypothetical protein